MRLRPFPTIPLRGLAMLCAAAVWGSAFAVVNPPPLPKPGASAPSRGASAVKKPTKPYKPASSNSSHLPPGRGGT